MSHLMLFLLWAFTLDVLGYGIPIHIAVFLMIISAVIDGIRLTAWLERE